MQATPAEAVFGKEAPKAVSKLAPAARMRQATFLAQYRSGLTYRELGARHGVSGMRAHQIVRLGLQREYRAMRISSRCIATLLGHGVYV